MLGIFHLKLAPKVTATLCLPMCGVVAKHGGMALNDCEAKPEPE